jgi:hypothetical protein
MPQDTVPISQGEAPQAQGAGSTIDALLGALKQSNDAVYSAGQRVASSYSGQADASHPTVPQAITPYNGGAPLINKETTGAHATKAKGIANALIGGMNLVSSVSKIAAQHKQTVLANDITHVMNTTDQINQAKAVLAQDPKNADAQKMLKTATDNQNALLADPKKLKQISKAFDINFVDPSKNNSPEHGAMKQASESYSQQLQEKLPQNLVPNAAAVKQYQAAQESNKNLMGMIKTIEPILTQGMKSDQAAAHDTSVSHDVDKKAQTALHIQQANAAASMQRVQASDAAHIQASRISANAHLAGIAMEDHKDFKINADNIASHERIAANAQNSPAVRQKSVDEMTKSAAAIRASAIKSAADLQKLIASTKDKDTKAALTQQLKDTQEELKAADNQTQYAQGLQMDIEQAVKTAPKAEENNNEQKVTGEDADGDSDDPANFYSPNH